MYGQSLRYSNPEKLNHSQKGKMMLAKNLQLIVSTDF